ncbi:MAG: hypothetical protein V8Q12_06170 [Agathobacter rectalis]
MPFIDSKISIPVSREERENLKADLGRAISIVNKPEGFLMLGFEDNYDLYMGGKKLDKGAFVSVKLFGSASAREYNAMTAEICRIFKERLGIPGNESKGHHPYRRSKQLL